MEFRILGALLAVAGLAIAATAFYAAGPQPALDADGVASNQLAILFLGGCAAMLLIGGLTMLLSARKQ